MIDRRLLRLVYGAVGLIAQTVALQWLSLIANAVMVFTIGAFLQDLFQAGFFFGPLLVTVGVCIAVAGVRYVVTLRVGISSHELAFAAKRSLRERLYVKLLALGPSYTRHLATSEVIQLAGEGIEQLEVYFSKYLPQLIYCILAPLSLFAILAFIDIRVALVLLACVPLIPVSIMIIQKRARKAFVRYWDEYVDLGGGFLESLQALNTLKLYQADAAHQRRMDADAETFRKATMRVLRLQLASVTVMDAIAYGGAAAGIIIAVLGLEAGAVSLAGCFVIVVLSAEFFIPMRQLGALFHVAMNGMSASEKLFALLDLDEASGASLAGPQRADSGEGGRGAEGVDRGPATVASGCGPATGRGPATVASATTGCTLRAQGLGFSYDGRTAVLSDIDLEVARGAPVALVGPSGSGKSTLAALLGGRQGGYEGSLTLGEHEVSGLVRERLMQTVVLTGDRSHLFKATVRENLAIARPDASDEQMWQVLEQVRLSGMLRVGQGLDTALGEGASNLSGGQRQRLALARALLADAEVYLFDEATSNIDVESETCIMEVIASLARRKPVLIISHRLANVEGAACIHVLKDATICERGTHEELLAAQGVYAEMYGAQRELEEFAPAGHTAQVPVQKLRTRVQEACHV
ncbi:MAG: ABC transporter ATP-binding protein/permease [Coriobacteriales bacterium]|jgi:ABC-type transport system involved in cytochrome bd biosynthesis fused ATPase/permease subunit|nr:ABC transporter ATP-binding protein/permease [Coriobacteriales bacterium]